MPVIRLRLQCFANPCLIRRNSQSRVIGSNRAAEAKYAIYELKPFNSVNVFPVRIDGAISI